MDFGLESYSTLVTEDFILPPEAEFYFDEKPVKPKIFIGLPKWTDEKVIGEKVKSKDQLGVYVKLYNSVELNATNYSIPDANNIRKWREAVAGTAFLYCPKMFQGITARGSLLDKESMVTDFLNSVQNLKDNLGPIFIQMKEYFKPTQRKELYEFLHSLPRGQFKFFLELRHSEWFSNSDINTELYDNLNQLNIGMVITDTPAFRHSVQMKFPIPSTFIRFVCRGDKELDIFRIQQWKKQLAYLGDHGISDVYFFLHIHDVFAIKPFSEYVQKEFML